jgi:hypothetical protein
MRIHVSQFGKAAVKDPFSTLQEKDGDLFGFANRNHSSKSARGLACLLRRDVPLTINKRFDPSGFPSFDELRTSGRSSRSW